MKALKSTTGLLTVQLVSTSIARTIVYQVTLQLQQQNNNSFTMSSNPAYDSVAHASVNTVSMAYYSINCYLSVADSSTTAILL